MPRYAAQIGSTLTGLRRTHGADLGNVGLYILERYFLTPRRWPLGGLPWDGEPSESAALVVAAGQRLSLPVDVALTLQRVSVLEVCRAGGSDNGATPSRRAKAGGRTWWKGCRASPPAWSRPVTTALWGSSVCQGRSAANPPASVAAALSLGRGSSGSARASAGVASSRHSPSTTTPGCPSDSSTA